MKLRFRLWIVFSCIWLALITVLYLFIATLYNERALDNQKEVAQSQGYVISGRISSLIPKFFDRAEGYADYYSELFGLRVILLSSDKELIYDSYKQLTSNDQLRLSILEQPAEELPASIFLHTESYGYVQHTLLPIDQRAESGYILMIHDANYIKEDMARFRSQVLISLGITTMLSLLIFYIVASWFTQPIRRIMTHLQQITPQRREFAMRYRNKDEIGQLVTEIKQMVEQVNAYEQRQRRFISTSSHELKTPLATIQLIAENLPSLRDNQALYEEYVEDLQLQINKMRATIQGMLDVYRLTDKPLELSAIEFSRIRDHLDKQFKHVAEHKQITLSYEHTVPVIFADQSLLFSSLENLVSNALRYSPEQTTILISCVRNSQQEIMLSVCDQGIGISTEDLPYIFEPFYRANEATRWSQEGSGLGLAIVKQMIELHGGSIKVASEQGIGTCVHLYFRDKTVTK